MEQLSGNLGRRIGRRAKGRVVAGVDAQPRPAWRCALSAALSTALSTGLTAALLGWSPLAWSGPAATQAKLPPAPAGALSAPASGAAEPAAADWRQRLERLPAREHEQAVALLRQGLATALPVEQRLALLDRLTEELIRLRRWPELKAAADEALALSARTPGLQVRFATQRGYAWQTLARPLEALRDHEDLIAPLLPALSQSSRREDRLLVADAMRMKGSVLLALSRKPEAMEQLTQALQAYDQLQHAEGQALTLHVIAAVRAVSGDLAEAIRAERQAIAIAEREAVPAIRARLYRLLSYYLDLDHQAESVVVQAFEQAERHARIEGDDFVLAMVLYNRGDMAMRHRMWTEALDLTRQAEQMFEHIGDRNMVAMCWANRGEILATMGQPQGVVLVARAAEALFAVPGQEPTALGVQQTLAELLAAQGRHKEAYETQLAFQRRSDVVRQADNQRRIAEAEARYQAEKRQRQLDELQSAHALEVRNRWMWVLVGVLGLAVAAVAGLSRLYLKRAYRAMADMALEDPLTGLHNRRYLSQRMAADIARIRRDGGHRVHTSAEGGPLPTPSGAFLLVDLDHFKAVNDRHGHAAGDAVLCQTARILKDVVRASDVVVRWGGEEFLIFATVSSRSELGELAERLLTAIAGHAFEVGEPEPLRLTASLGYASYPFAGDAASLPGWETLVGLADQCLYLAKDSGRDMWVGALPRRDDVRLADHADLHQAQAQGQVTLVHRARRQLVMPPAPASAASAAAAPVTPPVAAPGAHGPLAGPLPGPVPGRA